MVALGILFCIFGLGSLSWVLFDIIVYALPVAVGLTAGFAAYYSGAGEIGIFVVGPIAGMLTFGAERTAIQKSQSQVIRTVVALLFVVPAACVGYSGMLDLALWFNVPSVIWQQVYALLGAIVVGSTAFVRLTNLNPPDSEWR
jgi:hypothetical protein